MAARLPEGCPCGRSLPILSEVHGRRTEWLVARPGTQIHPQTLRNILRSVDGVRRFQLVQERPGTVTVVTVIAPDAGREAIRTRILEDVRRLDVALDAEVEFADSLPRMQGGKVRAVLTRAGSAR